MHWARRQKYGICGAVQAGRRLSTVYLPCTLFGLFCCLPVETANGTTWGLSILVNYCLLLGTGRTHGNLRLKKSKLRWGWLGGKWRYICRWGGGAPLADWRETMQNLQGEFVKVLFDPHVIQEDIHQLQRYQHRGLAPFPPPTPFQSNQKVLKFWKYQENPSQISHILCLARRAIFHRIAHYAEWAHALLGAPKLRGPYSSNSRSLLQIAHCFMTNAAACHALIILTWLL